MLGIEDREMIREIINQKPTFEEFKKIYDWVENKSELTTKKALGLAIQIAKVCKGKNNEISKNRGL